MAKTERPFPQVDELRTLALTATAALARLAQRADEIELTAAQPTKRSAGAVYVAARVAEAELQSWLTTSVEPPFVREQGRREGGA